MRNYKSKKHYFDISVRKDSKKQQKFLRRCDMDKTGYTYYQAAYKFFEEQQYEKAVENFIMAYDRNICQEEILENLYACFIAPNEAEFKKNYEENRKDLLNIPYEDLEIDFIPVSNSNFYLFHRKSQEFMGSFSLDDSSIMKNDVDFESILIADCWDFRQMLSLIKENTWEIVYILLNEHKSYFASFFKLPRFRELYMNNAIIFENAEIMRMFFEEYSDFYLPKRVFASDNNYSVILTEIHKKRLANSSAKRKNIFLSILIPSYNRGNKALSAIQEICCSVYDSEIEVIVSDNGSDLYAQEYQSIHDIQDSRIRYHRNEHNMGFLENVMVLLDMAKGKYAILSSDEDIMLISNLPYYLNLIKKHGDCGVFCTSGMLGNFGTPEDETVRVHGVKAVLSGINTNYATGVGYNMALLRQMKLTEFIRQHLDNAMVNFYPHCVMNLKMAFISDMLICGKPPLWIAGEPGEAADGTDSKTINTYMTIDSREAQYVGTVNLYIEAGLRGRPLCILYMERCRKFFWLLYIAMNTYPSYYEERHISWEDMLSDAAKRCQKNLALLKNCITPQEQDELVKDINDLQQIIRTNGFH